MRETDLKRLSNDVIPIVFQKKAKLEKAVVIELTHSTLPDKDSSNSWTTSVCPKCAATTAGLSSVGSIGSSTRFSVSRNWTVSRSPWAAEMLSN